MNVVSAVANLQKERDYYKAQFDEALNIIKQLDEGPREVAYIHPWDLAELFNEAPPECITDVLRHPDYLEIKGKKYKQSALIPARTKNIK